MPPPPGFVAGEGHGSNFMKAVEATDPTTITSIIKFWYEAEQRWGVEITWVGGVAPYSLVASTTPSFEWEVETLAKEISGPSFTDHLAGEIVDNLFYNVTDLSVISPAVEGRGYEPEPAPGPPITMTQFVWWGSTVIFTAGFLDPIAPANLSFFNRRAEKASDAADPDGSGYSPWVQFEVPWDARSTIPATIQSHSRMSPGGYYANMIPQTPDLVFTNIRGVVWAPEVGEAIPDVWVAADGVVAQVNLFTDDPSKVLRVTDIQEPYISRVSEIGTLVVVEGHRDAPPSAVYQVDTTTGNKTWFANTNDSDFTREIEPVGIALSPDGQTCFIADKSSRKVVKIPEGAGPGFPTIKIKDAWGGKSDFVFADAAPIDVSVGGSVLVINNAHPYPLWELIDEDTAIDTGLRYGQHSHVLQVDRDLSTSTVWRALVSAAPAAAEAFNRKPIDQFPAAYHGSIVYGGAGVLNLYPEDREGQVYTIWPRDPQRVIISNAGQSVPYTSSLQVTDRVIGFEVTGWEGLEFRLELIDPPDTAAYAPAGGWPLEGRTKQLPYEGNDNIAAPGTDGIGLSLNPTGPWTPQLNVTPVGGDTATVYLQVTDRYAGDNYQVQVKKCRPGGCDAAPPAGGVLDDRVVALSPIFTAWKRIYLERDKMFRRGGVLAADYLTEEGTCGGVDQDPCCGQAGALACDQVKVFRWDEVSTGDWIVLFDLLESLPDYSFFFERIFPVRQVLAVSDPDPDGFRVVTFDQSLDRNLRASSITDATPAWGFQPDFENNHTAGFGVVSPGCDLGSTGLNGADSCFFEADLRGIEKPFADPFVEVYAPRSGVSFLPYLPDQWFTWQNGLDPGPPIMPWDNFSWIWFDHRSQDPSNYRHLIGASSAWLGAMYGLTTATNYHWTYVFRGSNEDRGAGHTPEEVDHFTQHTTAHELGHHFRTCWCNPGQGGEHHVDDVNPVEAWCEDGGLCPPFAPPPELCIMNSGDILGLFEQEWDSFFRFDVECLFTGDPDCVDPPGPEPPGGSIRGKEDPLF